MTTSPDQQLINLGTQAATFEAAFDRFENDNREPEDVPGYLEGVDAHVVVLEKIISVQATTLAGLRVKAERIAHWRKGLDDETEMDNADLALALSIVHDLRAMQGC